MKKIPEMLEVVTFVCSGCGNRSSSVASEDKMKCRVCKEIYLRKDGQWMPEKWQQYLEEYSLSRVFIPNEGEK